MTTPADELALEITPQDLAARLKAGAGAPVLLDVRQPEEHAYVRLESSRLVPLPELAARLDELARTIGRDAEIVAYCHHGVRSMQAAQYLRARGFARARSLAGGIAAWTRAVDPSLPGY